MGGNEIQITLSGQAADRLRSAFPTGRLSINRKAEKIILEWLEDREDMKAADTSERRSKGKPNVKAADLFKECGL